MAKRVRFAQPERSYGLHGDELSIVELFDHHVERCSPCYEWIFKEQGTLCTVGYRRASELLELVKQSRRQKSDLKVPSQYKSIQLLIKNARDGRFQQLSKHRDTQDRQARKYSSDPGKKMRLLAYASGGAVVGGIIYGLVKYAEKMRPGGFINNIYESDGTTR